MKTQPPPLTTDDLIAIRDAARYIENPKHKQMVLHLLWDIHRLHKVVRRAAQVVTAKPEEYDCGVGQCLMNELKREPIVKQYYPQLEPMSYALARARFRDAPVEPSCATTTDPAAEKTSKPSTE